MGACYLNRTFEDQSEEELIETVMNECQEDCLEYGHGGYTGTWAEKDDVEFHPSTVSNEDKAKEICDKGDKWGPLIAVKVITDTTYWYVGGWCSS